MTNKISIPKPCHEDWNNMSPEQQGRHCMACNKTVIDFTNWDENQIRNYLESRSSERVCGRFNITQLEIVKEEENVLPIILKSNISILKKIAAIVLLCFGAFSSQSCAQETQGEVKSMTTVENSNNQTLGVILVEKDTTKTSQVPLEDTTKYVPQIMGKIAPYKPPKDKPIKKAIALKKNKK